ncbi:putative tricarboxylic transport membrane protein [Humibacillus xanthopallidus]|uniref:Putative tricarboxylic transport membrane protein n=1 Tax=Humibacillus xanthopallidus TaxID=412689 RepID=A0A543PMC3_9MICO|nr:tripartite tricarboxylate transporter TctB family protein [Humibacillus xanthopallidus]TQN45220.1 putative tricarboxylic transport membrane protein [Humibacillus xanthopallidus]
MSTGKDTVVPSGTTGGPGASLPPVPPDRVPDATRDSTSKNYSEYGVAVLLLALGVWAITDAMSLTDLASSKGPVGAKTVPMLVGGLLVLMAILLAVDIARGGRGEQEGGEDVDLSHGSDWRTIGLLAGAFVANALLIERIGWPLSGAILFFGTTYALGSRHYVRNAIISLVMSVGSWYLFYAGLGIKLPVGLLKGIL